MDNYTGICNCKIETNINNLFLDNEQSANNMTNEEIYTTALDLSKNIVNANLHLPVKVNFYLQKSEFNFFNDSSIDALAFA